MQRDLSLYNMPPQALEAEAAVLSRCIIDGLPAAKQAIELLRSKDFYRSAHQKIFAAIYDLASDEEPIDLVVIVDTLRARGQLEEVGGATYISQLIDDIPTSTHLESHAKIVLEKANLRRIIEKCNEVAKKCFESSTETVDTIVESAQQFLSKIEVLDKSTFKSAQELTEERIDFYEERQSNAFDVSGIPSGLTLLDALTLGFQPTDLILLAARPSMGKTALSVNFACHAANNDIPTAIFSLEMSKEQLFDRILSGETRINSMKFRKGNFGRDDWERMSEVFPRISDWPLFIDDSGALHYRQIQRRARQMHKKHGIKLIIIDYLQLMIGDQGQSRDREIGSISGGMKALAKELQVPVILLSQLNRNVEQRTNKRPILSDLRESGSLENDADLVMFLYRDDYYNKADDNPERGKAELDIAKYRNGPTGFIRLVYHKEYSKFFDLSDREPF